jgi:hypothetical protein
MGVKRRRYYPTMENAVITGTHTLGTWDLNQKAGNHNV